MISENFFATGRIIRQPVALQPGYWAGAPGVFFDPQEEATYLAYRIRRPRGVAPDRGGEARIARSTDGENFEDVWMVTKDKFESASIERCALRRGRDGQWRFFVSYVDPVDGRWCVDLLKAAEVSKLDPARRTRLFSAKALGLEGVKDPWILEASGGFFMFLSVAIPTARTKDSSHDTLDIYNTGECLSGTALAFSRDLDEWQWNGIVFAPEGRGWDGYCRRINCVIAQEERWLAFYDGSSSEKENYEERTGLAEFVPFAGWRTRTASHPFLTSPFASRSLRYLDALRRKNRFRFFYEFARDDGSHDLRSIEVEANSIDLSAEF